MILYKITKAKIIRSSDVDIESIDLVAGVLQRDILAPYVFIISLDYLLQIPIHLNLYKNFIINYYFIIISIQKFLYIYLCNFIFLYFLFYLVVDNIP